MSDPQTYLPEQFTRRAPTRKPQYLNQNVLAQKLAGQSLPGKTRSNLKRSRNEPESSASAEILSLTNDLSRKLHHINSCKEKLYDSCIDFLKGHMQAFITSNYQFRKISRTFAGSDEDLEDTQNDLDVTERSMKNIPSALLITGALDLSNCMEMFETDLDADSSRPSPKYVEFHPLHSKSVNNLMQQLAYQVFDDEDPTKLNKKFKIFGKLIDAICHWEGGRVFRKLKFRRYSKFFRNNCIRHCVKSENRQPRHALLKSSTGNTSAFAPSSSSVFFSNSEKNSDHILRDLDRPAAT